MSLSLFLSLSPFLSLSSPSLDNLCNIIMFLCVGFAFGASERKTSVKLVQFFSSYFGVFPPFFGSRGPRRRDPSSAPYFFQKKKRAKPTRLTFAGLRSSVEALIFPRFASLEAALLLLSLARRPAREFARALERSLCPRSQTTTLSTSKATQT